MAMMRSRALRSVAAALAVGAPVGLIVAGGGARLAMGLIALADDREDFGSITGSGAFVGEITCSAEALLKGAVSSSSRPLDRVCNRGPQPRKSRRLRRCGFGSTP